MQETNYNNRKYVCFQFLDKFIELRIFKIKEQITLT
jgi:hypothetical protein